MSNEILMKSDKSELVETYIPVCIYDFNGLLAQYHHLIEIFIDKSALLVICVDASRIQANHTNLKGDADWEIYLRKLLDLIVFKMSKITQYSILFVLTKSDQILDEDNPQLEEFLVKKVENFISGYFELRLEDIRAELAKIELAQNITASQSDRLKQLIQTQKNLKPHIFKKIQVCIYNFQICF